jgi:hypothetical protein
LATFLALLGFTLSFLALRDVGLAWGVAAPVSWAFPLLIDGFIVLATWVAWRFQTDGLRATWYPWSALVVFSVLSVVGNAMHAHPTQVGALLLTPWQAAAFSSIPPVALLVASHMLVVIATQCTRRVAGTRLGGCEGSPSDGPGGGERPREMQGGDDWLTRAGIEAPSVAVPVGAGVARESAALVTRMPVGGAGADAVGSAGRAPGLRLVPDPPRGVDLPDEFVAWVAERVAHGEPVATADARRLFPDVGSVSTVRRKLLALTGAGGELSSAAGAAAWLARDAGRYKKAGQQPG